MFQIALKKLRENNGMSQKKLAEELGLSQSTVGMWESGKNRPEYSNLLKLAEIFNVSVSELTENESFEIEKSPHDNDLDKEQKQIKSKNDLEKIIQDYVVNKELFHPDSDSYEDLKKIMAEIISNNENIILEILNNRRNLNERK